MSDKERLLPHPPGHFHSPINDPALLDSNRLRHTRNTFKPEDALGIALNLERQRLLWTQFANLFSFFEFPLLPDGHHRYYSTNPVYGVGDALILFCMIGCHKPVRIIEIGSGFSSACILDTVDQLKIESKITFIDPDPQRLRALLRPDDWKRCKVLLQPVQETDFALYESLKKDDILFIDSTHVMKAGSDVNFEIFEILPRLSSGVIIHFHDIFWPFEYPADWLVNRLYSWNELYGLRAFLAYNNEFEILFFNDLFGLHCRDLILNANLPINAKGLYDTTGGGLWLRKA